MRTKPTSLLLAAILVLGATSILQSCSAVYLNNSTSNHNGAVARLYISLSSNAHNREYEIIDVEEILTNHFEGATIQEAAGLYNGKRERSLVVTIINCCRWEVPNDTFKEKINKLAAHLKQGLGQESVLIEYSPIEKTQAYEIYE